MSGYVIVIRPEDETGYTAQTYPLDEQGLLAVIALLEMPQAPFHALVEAHRLHLRRTPAGEVIAHLKQGTRLLIQPPTTRARLNGTWYEWGQVIEPQQGWVALGAGLARPLATAPAPVDNSPKSVDNVVERGK